MLAAEQVIISTAVTGSVNVPSQSDALPLSADQVVASVDRAGATGRLSWFGRLGLADRLDFPLPEGSAGDLALVGDRGVLAVLVGGRRVATVTDPNLGAPTSAGVAVVGDTAGCDFDDVTVTTAS